MPTISDLHREIEHLQGLRWDAVSFVAQHDDGAGARRREVTEPDGFVGELNTDDLGRVRLTPQPPSDVAVYPVDT